MHDDLVHHWDHSDRYPMREVTPKDGTGKGLDTQFYGMYGNVMSVHVLVGVGMVLRLEKGMRR